MIKHALTFAAARAVLTTSTQQGLDLQAGLEPPDVRGRRGDQRRATGAMGCRSISSTSARSSDPPSASPRFAGLFQYYLREQGVHTNPPSPSFLSTAHSAADIEPIVAAYIAAGREMGATVPRRRLRPGASVEATAGDAARATPPRPQRRRRLRLRARRPRMAPLPVLPNVARFLVERSTPNPGPLESGRSSSSRPEPLDPRAGAGVVERLLERHDALRLRFTKGSNGWEASIAPSGGSLPFEPRPAVRRCAKTSSRQPSSGCGQSSRAASTSRRVRSLRVATVRPRRARPAPARHRPPLRHGRALVAAVLGGLRRDPRRPRAGSTGRRRPSATSFGEWAHLLKQRADSAELRGEIQRLARARLGRRPTHPARPPGTARRQHERSRLASSSSTSRSRRPRAIFQETPGVPHKVDFLLTALAQMVAEWTGSRTVLFDMMGHGRDEHAVDDVDLFGSVGFFISYTPMVLTCRATAHPTRRRR